MEVGRQRDVMANEHISLGNNLYEKMKIFKYLESLLTNKNSICEEIESRK